MSETNACSALKPKHRDIADQLVKHHGIACLTPNPV